MQIYLQDDKLQSLFRENSSFHFHELGSSLSVRRKDAKGRLLVSTPGHCSGYFLMSVCARSNFQGLSVTRYQHIV